MVLFILYYYSPKRFFSYLWGVMNPWPEWLVSFPISFFSILILFFLYFSFHYCCSFLSKVKAFFFFYKPILPCLYWLKKDCKLPVCLPCVETHISGKKNFGSWGKPTLCFGPLFQVMKGVYCSCMHQPDGQKTSSLVRDQAIGQ